MCPLMNNGLNLRLRELPVKRTPNRSAAYYMAKGGKLGLAFGKMHMCSVHPLTLMVHVRW